MPDDTKPNKMLGIGIGGAAIMALCCFTPALVALLAAVVLLGTGGIFMARGRRSRKSI